MPARGALTFFHLRGIRIGVDYSWFVVLFLVVVWLSSSFRSQLGAEQSDLEPYFLAVSAALLFFGSILLHELGHALVAIRRGIAISDITLWMFGGVARMSRDSDSAGTEFKIAVAGPLVTLAIAAACVGIGIAFAGAGDFRDAMLVREDADTSGVLALIAWLGSINFLVLLFNLIPAFPLDGGRIARSIAWGLTGDRTKATRFAATLGQLFAYVFMAIGVLLLLTGNVIAGIWLAVIGFILSSAARGTLLQTEFTRRIEGIRVADVMDAEPVAIPEDATVERALDEYFLRYRWPSFPVVDAAQRFLGLLERGAADAVPELRRAQARVSEVFQANAAHALDVRADAPLETVLGNENLRRVGALFAVDADGRLRGVITADRIGRVLRSSVPPATG